MTIRVIYYIPNYFFLILQELIELGRIALPSYALFYPLFLKD
jgi:hypothetical protein